VLGEEGPGAARRRSFKNRRSPQSRPRAATPSYRRELAGLRSHIAIPVYGQELAAPM
jgi:hypothetical protein